MLLSDASQKAYISPANSNFKYMRLAALLYITILQAATVCAYKVVKIGFLPEPGSTLIYTFSFFWGNVFAEVYGSNLSKKLIWETIFCQFIFALLIFFVSLLPSPAYFDRAKEFSDILGHVLRFTLAGSIGYLLGSFLNIYVVTKWKAKMHGKFFWLRSLVAASISEGVATFLVGVLTFFGMMSMHHILQLMTYALAFKLLYGVVAVWPASFVAFLLKRAEREVSIEHPSFNPFEFHDK